MKKTIIYLEQDQYILLKEASALKRGKMSEIIREALAIYLKTKKQNPDYFSFVGIAQGPKNGKTSEKAEEILLEALRSSS